MLVVSPARDAILKEARKLVAAGKREEAYNKLVQDRYDHGIDPVLDAELQKRFPAPPEHLATLDLYRRQLADADAKARQKVARQISRFSLGSVSNRILEFVRHRETVAFFIREMENPDPIVGEQMTMSLARALDKYIHDDRAYGPLVAMLDSPRENARGWAIEGLAALTDEFLPHALRLLNDESGRVREAADSSISLSLRGGGTIHRPPLGPAARLRLRDAMLAFDLKLPAADRITRVWFLAQTAEPADLPVLKDWQSKDRSKEVRELLKEGIDRLGAG